MANFRLIYIDCCIKFAVFSFFKCLSALPPVLVLLLLLLPLPLPVVNELGDDIGSFNFDEDEVGLPLKLWGKVVIKVGEVGGWCVWWRLLIESSNLNLKSLFKYPSLLLDLLLNLFEGLIIVLEGVEESNSESSSDIIALEFTTPPIIPLTCFEWIWVKPWVAECPDNDTRLVVLLFRVCDRRLSSMEMIEFLGLLSKLTIDILRKELGVAVTLSFWLIALDVRGGNIGVVDVFCDVVEIPDAGIGVGVGVGADGIGGGGSGDAESKFEVVVVVLAIVSIAVPDETDAEDAVVVLLLLLLVVVIDVAVCSVGMGCDVVDKGGRLGDGEAEKVDD